MDDCTYCVEIICLCYLIMHHCPTLYPSNLKPLIRKSSKLRNSEKPLMASNKNITFQDNRIKEIYL